MSNNFADTPLAVVDVDQGGPQVGDPKEYIKAQLKAAAKAFLTGPVRDRVITDLDRDLSLGAFVWHKPIDAKELTGKQTLAFDIKQDPSGNFVFLIDDRSYTPGRIDRTLPLGGSEEWTLSSRFVNHPFHIHVNPFQIVKVIKTDTQEDVSGNSSDPDYANMKGAWKDTIFVKQGYEVIMRTRYERYIGDFVLHCHILDHEDNGMMQNIRIAVPDGKGGIAHGHH
jgi:L-ascorbate oxidase